jgi:hypothetical protein
MYRPIIVLSALSWSTAALAGPCVFAGDVPGYVMCVAQQASDAFDLASDNADQLDATTYIRRSTDGGPEVLSPVSAPYHMTVTAMGSAGTSRPIPLDVLDALCGDPDGCAFRLGMTRWSSIDDRRAAANDGGRLYYSPSDGAWRSDRNDGNFTSGDGVIDHVRNAASTATSDDWDTCYFTDGNYIDYVSLGDLDRGLSLLLWNGYTGPNRTCELTLID